MPLRVGSAVVVRKSKEPGIIVGEKGKNEWEVELEDKGNGEKVSKIYTKWQLRNSREGDPNYGQMKQEDDSDSDYDNISIVSMQNVSIFIEQYPAFPSRINKQRHGSCQDGSMQGPHLCISLDNCMVIVIIVMLGMSLLSVLTMDRKGTIRTPQGYPQPEALVTNTIQGLL